MTSLDGLPDPNPDPGRDLPDPSRSASVRRSIRLRRLLVATAVVLAVGGTTAIIVSMSDQHHPPRPSGAAQSAPLPGTASPSSATPATAAPGRRTTQAAPPSVTRSVVPDLSPLQSGLWLPTSQPIQLIIPAIGVSTSIMNLGLNPDSTLQTPPLSRNSVAGWYELSPTPGSLGASVMLGHVDSAAYGAGVFFRLGALNPGDEVDVRRQDGTVAVFRIDRVAEYPKTQFPSALVYGKTSYAALRLVTCGGSFDSSTRNYRDNVIAFASLASTRRT